MTLKSTLRKHLGQSTENFTSIFTRGIFKFATFSLAYHNITFLDEKSKIILKSKIAEIVR